MRKFIVTIFFILVLMFTVKATEQICYSATPCIIEDYLYNNTYDYINTATACTVTVFNSTNNIIVNNQYMTNNSYGLYNYTLWLYYPQYYYAFMNCSYSGSKIYIDKTINLVGNVEFNITSNFFNNEINTVVTDVLQGEFNMIGIIMLWLGMWIFGYYCFQNKNEMLGITMIVLTIPIDLYFSYLFREEMYLGTGFLGIAMGFMTAWTIGIILLLKRNIGKKYN